MEPASSYIEALFGGSAVSVPFNAVVQADRETKTVMMMVVIKGDDALKLMHGSENTHQLIIGDAVIRPHLVFESNHLEGVGMGGIARSGFDPEDWLSNGRCLLDRGVRPDVPNGKREPWPRCGVTS